MGNIVAVTFYFGLGEKSHVIDSLVQPEVSVVWEPALADIQQENVRRLLEMANVSPSAWRQDLISRFGFDVLEPTAEALGRVGVPANRIEYAMRDALEQQENWELQGPDIDDLWSFDPDLPQNLSPSQVYEVLGETGARGTPVISFQADEDEIASALAEDNLVTVKGLRSVFAGLSDPINGYNHSPGRLETVTFRPSSDGIVVLGDDHLLEGMVEDAYMATVTHVAAPEVRFSSRSEETRRLDPPHVRDTRQAAPSAVGMRP